MAIIKKWRMVCQTDGVLFVQSSSEPTECPVDSGHTVAEVKHFGNVTLEQVGFVMKPEELKYTSWTRIGKRLVKNDLNTDDKAVLTVSAFVDTATQLDVQLYDNTNKQSLGSIVFTESDPTVKEIEITLPEDANIDLELEGKTNSNGQKAFVDSASLGVPNG